MKDLVFYSNAIVLILNVLTFIVLIHDKHYNHKLARVMVLVSFSIGTIVFFGKETWFNIIFCFAPFISLININKNAKFIKYFRSNKQRLENIQGNNKAVSKQA